MLRPQPLAPLLLAPLLLGLPCFAQVTVGYANPIAASAARSRIELEAIRATRRFEVTGLNVQPADGSLIYNQTTEWRIVNPSAPSSLSVLNLDPQLELQQRSTRRDDLRVQRTESVFASVSGPLATTLPADPRDLLRPQELALPAPLLTVFPDPAPSSDTP